MRVNKFTCNARDLGLIPGLGRYPGEGNANLLQYSCLENSMDRGSLVGYIHGGAELYSAEVTEHVHTQTHLEAHKSEFYLRPRRG